MLSYLSYLKIRPRAAIASSLLLTGCATVKPQAAFQSVQDQVAAQTGFRTTWNQNSADDQRAEAAVRNILAHPLSADDAVRVALLGNPELQASFEEIGISKADLVQAGLLHNPTLMASWRFPDRPPSITDSEYSIAADFLDLVMIPMRVKISRANLEQTELRLDHEVLRLVTEVKSAFYEYQGDVQLMARLDLIGEVDRQGADLAKAQHDAGNITDLELADREAQSALAHVYLANAKKEKLAAREKLNRLMGLSDAGLDWKAAPNLPELPAHDGSLANLESRALAQRRDLAAAKREVDALAMALALKTNTRFVPTEIRIGVDTEKSSDTGQHLTGPTLDLTLPIFDQGQGDIAKLTAQHHMAERRMQALAIRIRSDVRQARETLKMQRELAEYYRKTVVPLNLKIVNDTQAQFNAMQKSTYDLFAGKQRELEAEKGYVEAWRDYWIARAELEQAVGGRLSGAAPAKSLSQNSNGKLP